MALVMALTDQYGTVHSSAYGLVTMWNLQNPGSIGNVALQWWTSKAAFQGNYAPFRTDPITLSAAEQNAGASQLMGVLESMIYTRPAYTGSAIST